MNDFPRTKTFVVLTWEQFRARMLEAIIKHNERLTKEQLCEDLMDVAKPALHPDNLTKFLEAMLFSFAPIPPCFIETSQSDMLYFFTGTHAVIVTIPRETPGNTPKTRGESGPANRATLAAVEPIPPQGPTIAATAPRGKYSPYDR